MINARPSESDLGEGGAILAGGLIGSVSELKLARLCPWYPRMLDC